MAKRPTPKQKLCKSRTRRRYQAYQTMRRKKLTNSVKLVVCPSCGAKMLSHVVCKQCGKYKGRQVLNVEKEMKKITKIKA